jgi:hypothetical protein
LCLLLHHLCQIKHGIAVIHRCPRSALLGIGCFLQVQLPKFGVCVWSWMLHRQQLSDCPAQHTVNLSSNMPPKSVNCSFPCFDSCSWVRTTASAPELVITDVFLFLRMGVVIDRYGLIMPKAKVSLMPTKSMVRCYCCFFSHTYPEALAAAPNPSLQRVCECHVLMWREWR